MYKRVRGVGPANCYMMVVGSKPGREEALRGMPFVGKTGRELNRYLDGVDRPHRDDCYLTNVYRQHYDDKYHDYTAEEFAQDSAELQSELDRAQPELVVTLGVDACRWFLGKEVDIEDCFALPWQTEKFVVFPIHHPAAGFHSPETQAAVWFGFDSLAAYLRGDILARRLYDDPHPNPTYTEITDPAHIIIDPSKPLSIDSEGYPHNPWSLQYSQQAGQAGIIRAKNRATVDEWGKLLRLLRPRIVFHNALHDLSVLRVMGVETNDLHFDDTMVMSYLLQVEPRGLKPLCVRHCGMQMQSYDDVMGDAANKVTIEYLVMLWDCEQHAYEERQHEEFNKAISTPGKNGKPRNIRTLPKLPRTPLHKAVERGLRSKNPRKLWGDQVDDIHVAAYHRLGPLPEATLDLVPPATAVHYGGRDADGTGRLEAQLKPRLDALGLSEVYRLELATYPLIDRMHTIGIKPDLQHFAALSTKLGAEIGRLQSELDSQTGRVGINANSGDQVADYLFDDLALDGMKKTESGRYSTNDKILEALEHMYPEHGAISTIRSYREIYKLKNTFCVAPETKVLTAALTWREAGEVAIGDPLLGFDEDTRYGSGNDHHRHWRVSQVLDTGRIRKPCYRLTFDDGTSVVCSTDHQWLVRSAGSYEKAVWVRSDALCIEDRPKNTRYGLEVIKPLDMWETEDNYDGGYIGGVFDGEGCLQRPRYSIRLSFAQKEGVVLDTVSALLSAYGFVFNDSKNERIHHLIIGRSREVLRFLGMFRPLRLLKKFREISDADNLPRINMSRSVRVVKREFIGDQDVIALSTTTHTFVANGLASHNCDRIPDFVNRWPNDGRVHSTFRTTRVVTGRLAASDPNLLAQPKHGKFAKDFRRGWVAEEGHVLGEWDESQIELRGLAHLSQDPTLLGVYRGEIRNPDGSMIDLHARLAERIFGVKPKDQDKSKHRLPAKLINFLIPMGGTAKGLLVQLRSNGLNVTEDDAQRWLDETYELYDQVPVYQDRMVAEARRNGYIRCLSGRIRYIGGIRSSDDRVRAEAERFAFSTPVQESAQLIVKQAEKRIWNEVILPLQREGHYVEPILQVHDAIQLEMDEGLQDRVNVMMQETMTNVPITFSVPLVVDGEWGYSLGNMKAFTK